MIFDNEQVIGKKYHVSAIKNRNSVITSMVYLKINDLQIQQEVRFSPKSWFSLSSVANVDTLFSTERDVFCSTRNKFIAQRLQVVHQEQTTVEKNYVTDKIDELVTRKEECMVEKTCLSCGAANSKKNRACTSCSGALIKDLSLIHI